MALIYLLLKNIFARYISKKNTLAKYISEKKVLPAGPRLISSDSKISA